MAIRLTKEEKDEIYQMYLSGKYYLKEIAEWIGCSSRTIIKVIKERGVIKNDDRNKNTIRKCKR